MTRLMEIEARKNEMRAEVATADEKRLAEIDTELAELDAELTAINKRTSLAGKLGTAEAKPEQKKVEAIEASESEKRGIALKENRTVTITSSGLLMETTQATDIKPTFNEVSSLVDGVTIKNLPGGEAYQQPYATGAGTAGYTAEGVAFTSAEPTFSYAAIGKTKLTALALDTVEALKLPAAAYDAEVVKGIRTALRKKINTEILFGDGTAGKFVGIFDNGATAIDAATDVTISAIDEDTLDTITFGFGGDLDVEDQAVLLLTKTDLKSFAMLRDSNGKRIYDIVKQGNTGTIDGVKYIIVVGNDFTTGSSGDYLMAYGPLSNYTMAIFSGMDVQRSTDQYFTTDVIANKGSIYSGGNVTAKNGFLRIKKA